MEEQASMIWNQKLRYLNDIILANETLKKLKYNVDYAIFGRRFPSKLIIITENATQYQSKRVVLKLYFKLYKDEISAQIAIEQKDINALKEQHKNLTFRSFMNRFDIYEQLEDVGLFQKQLHQTKELQKQDGKEVVCHGAGVTSGQYHQLINMQVFNTKSACIIESELEIPEENNYYRKSFKHDVQLPFLRVFSLLHKAYVYVHINDITDYVYDKTAFQKLFLPKKMKTVLEKVFAYSVDNLTEDIVQNKHGGLIIMAEGSTGTGKTSTAEVYSEFNKKPLYIVQVDEIGTTPENIEKNLINIFRRVEKWDAIILFDEVDVFLSKRGEDIQRAAIVGIFLRLMDYFKGMMFMTTNRSEVIDSAILSRITLNIKYPDLTPKVRKLIWKDKLNYAGLKINSMNELSKLELNGRQIRNMVRLAEIIFDETIDEKEFIDLILNSIPCNKGG